MPLMPEYTALIDKIAILLTRKRYRLATAESCTGGLIAALCTDVAGSSEWFTGGIVSYSNALKIALLQVPPPLIEEHGAVSECVVRSMAVGALASCGAEAAIAVSGVAGPSGGTPEKPVGTVWIGLALAGSSQNGNAPCPCARPERHLPEASEEGPVSAIVRAERHHFSGGRGEVRRATAYAALLGMLRLLEEA